MTCHSKSDSFLQAEHHSVQNEVFELRSGHEVAASAKANDSDLAAEELEQALSKIRYDLCILHCIFQSCFGVIIYLLA